MKIKQLRQRQLNEALSLAYRVFCEYEAAELPEAAKQAFHDAIFSWEYRQTLKAYGAFEDDELIGIIAVRNEGSHIALFFVDAEHQKKGVGRSLWNTVLAENTSAVITVHSSLYAAEIYKRLGFVQTDNVRQESGITFIPMEYRAVINENCPCKRKKCPRRGRCNECRAHHAHSGRPVQCEGEHK